eukprot:441022-Pelagomonas_calceolata.AAC.2
MFDGCNHSHWNAALEHQGNQRRSMHAFMNALSIHPHPQLHLQLYTCLQRGGPQLQNCIHCPCAGVPCGHGPECERRADQCRGPSAQFCWLSCPSTEEAGSMKGWLKGLLSMAKCAVLPAGWTSRQNVKDMPCLSSAPCSMSNAISSSHNSPNLHAAWL